MKNTQLHVKSLTTLVWSLSSSCSCSALDFNPPYRTINPLFVMHSLNGAKESVELRHQSLPQVALMPSIAVSANNRELKHLSIVFTSGSALNLDNTDPREAEKHRSRAQHLLSTILTHPHLIELNLSGNHLGT
jgi:hypothetical protein